MSLQPPKLPTWIFAVTNLALLAAAGFIAYNAHHPLTETTTFAIVACVIAGAIVGLVPIVAHYERRKNETLDQRQRELEALGRTISTSAEQISIAANGFNEITDLAHRNLKHAEQLPHKLQEKIAEFNSLLENAREDEREDMEKELAELRSSESERLQTITSQIHKAVAELAKIESVAQKQLAARTEIGDRINESIAKAHVDATRALNEASASFTRQVGELQARLLSDLEAKLTEHVSKVASATARETSAHVAAAAPTATATTENHAAPPPGETNGAAVPHAEALAPEAVTIDPTTSPKRPKKVRKEEAHPTELAANHNAPVVPEPAVGIPAAAQPEQVAAKAETDTHIIASPTASLSPSIPPTTISSPAIEPVVTPPERVVKKKPVKKSEPDSDNELSLGLSMDESPAPGSDRDASNQESEVVERILTSDGATRLIATAYIGIGNRLFVRGNGPGLSWDKGVPLQFVSIGKWRWETSEAQTPIEFKLLKNDEIECAALGTLKLDPGYQQEVTAKF
jgi:hypothetical protein